MTLHEKPSIRTKIYVNILNRPIFRPVFFIFEKLNLIVFHWDLRQKTIKVKSRNKKTCYIRRGAGKNDIAGLIGTYYLVGGEVFTALKLNQIPYVDFEKYPCQYSVDRIIANTKNAWEYYFEQPCGTDRKSAYGGGRIILSGWRLHLSKKEKNIAKEWEMLSKDERKSFLLLNMPVKECICEEVNNLHSKLFGSKSILGLFLRGTDYTARRPKGHDVQPTLQQAENKVNEFLYKYKIDGIFLVTEDQKIYDYMKKRYGDLIFCSDYNFVRFNSHTDKWVKDSFHNDPYERGKNYLIRVMLLSMCKYYVGSKASGARYAVDFGDFEDEYTFDLGVY